MHEIQGHAFCGDLIESALWGALTRKTNENLWNALSSLDQSESYVGYSRAREARADQLPAACMPVANASLIEVMLFEMQEYKKELNKHFVDLKKLPLTHDDDSQRVRMATHIRKMKEAEEEYFSNRDQRVAQSLLLVE